MSYLDITRKPTPSLGRSEDDRLLAVERLPLDDGGQRSKVDVREAVGSESKFSLLSWHNHKLMSSYYLTDQMFNATWLHSFSY